MELPVNFDNLRHITGGDADLESELFKNFLESSQDCIVMLHRAQMNGDESIWRSYAHAFKGICLNLGAGRLGNLCKQAQDDYRATAGEKEMLLAAIKEEFARVRLVLER